MKNLILWSLVGLLVASCGSDDKNTMVVNGTIKGLKKGTLYLQQIQDTILKNLDSLEIKGSGDFSFSTRLSDPDIFYLYLTKDDNNDINDRITFFGEPGIITITSSWNSFEAEAKITGPGSTSNEKYEEYRKGMARYNAKDLELLQAQFNPKFSNDSLAIDSLLKLSDKNLYRSYAYGLNFALNNKDSYVAPYVAVNEVAESNVKYLDSIYKMLTPEVAASKYGKKLKQHIEEVKKAKN
ncbi:DUF4369 domain-containing protein [Cellulophaga sp. Hel_I_12]|uniref:DUF4369 domain-containing protein n=1 Tax=Cellulophaga sp. Hel_I_12 TaxID=1249972 RepID=UPI00064914DE|nr:DUF4369 domain-containing protein [Cellulophaga sp. Hel_I_12]